MAVLISGFRATYLFPDKASFIVGGISCLFDSSTILFVVFQAMNSSLGARLSPLVSRPVSRLVSRLVFRLVFRLVPPHLHAVAHRITVSGPRLMQAGT
jgi:hypothetical protein